MKSCSEQTKNCYVFPHTDIAKKCRETAFSNDFSSYIIFMMLGADHLTHEGGGGGGDLF